MYTDVRSPVFPSGFPRDAKPIELVRTPIALRPTESSRVKTPAVPYGNFSRTHTRTDKSLVDRPEPVWIQLSIPRPAGRPAYNANAVRNAPAARVSGVDEGFFSPSGRRRVRAAKNAFSLTYRQSSVYCITSKSVRTKRIYSIYIYHIVSTDPPRDPDIFFVRPCPETEPMGRGGGHRKNTSATDSSNLPLCESERQTALIYREIFENKFIADSRLQSSLASFSLKSKRSETSFRLTEQVYNLIEYSKCFVIQYQFVLCSNRSIRLNGDYFRPSQYCGVFATISNCANNRKEN